MHSQTVPTNRILRLGSHSASWSRSTQIALVFCCVWATTALGGEEIDRTSVADFFSKPALMFEKLTEPVASISESIANQKAINNDTTTLKTMAAPSASLSPTMPSPMGESAAVNTWASGASHEQGASLWSPSSTTVMNSGYSPAEACPPNVVMAGEYVEIPNMGPSSWAQVDVLLWQIDGYATPALVTRGPAASVITGAGALGNSGTQVLYGNQKLGDKLLLGGRLQMGRWLSPKAGIQLDFFGLGRERDSAAFSGDGVHAFARPFYNTNEDVNAPDAQVFAMPGLVEGNARFENWSEIWSVGPSLRFNVCCNDAPGCHCDASNSQQLDFLLGYRFLRLEETFRAQGALRPLGVTGQPVTSYEFRDHIRTRNDFHGVELGINRLVRRGKWLGDVTAVCALGTLERHAQLKSSTRLTVPNVSDETQLGGFHIGPRDNGDFRDRQFTAIPQLRANLSYCLGQNCQLSAGYSLMYFDSVIRPGQFLNTSFDGSRLGQQVSFDESRTPRFRKDDMFLHGTTVGLTCFF